MGNFTKDRVILLKYRSGTAAAVPAYDRYTLENVMVRELFGTDAESVNAGGAVVYVLRDVSVCRGSSGAVTELPRLAKGDRCVLHAGTEAEVSMRVTEAGYFNGESLAHVRIRLK